MKEETVLVTGGAGFVGSAVVRRLVADGGRKVVVLDRLSYAGSLESLDGARASSRCVVERGDIRDVGFVLSVFRRHRPDAVLHLAAASHVDRSIERPPEFVGTNVTGTVRLLEAARESWADRASVSGGPSPASHRPLFVHVSTDEVYGDLADRDPAAARAGHPLRFSERSRYRPSSPYAASKAAADHFTRAWWRTYGLPTVVTHSSNNYGPWQHPEKLVPHMIVRALLGRPLPLYGDGRQVRDWIHVEDHARALRKVLDDGRPGATYDFGGEAERENRRVVELLCGILDRLRPRPGNASYRELLTFVEDRPGHDRRYAIHPERARSELGWRPGMTFEEGLEETVRWYLEHRAWWDRILGEGYRAERLGLPGGQPEAAVPPEEREAGP